MRPGVNNLRLHIDRAINERGVATLDVAINWRCMYIYGVEIDAYNAEHTLRQLMREGYRVRMHTRSGLRSLPHPRITVRRKASIWRA